MKPARVVEVKIGALLCRLLVLILWNYNCSQASSGQNDGVCVSQGGRFPKFSLENEEPRKACKGRLDLTLCRTYRKQTCCDVVQTYAAVMSLQRLATGGEASKECLEFWEVLECSICDPRVGITKGPPLLCGPFCGSVFSACADAFFSTDPASQVLVPCGSKDILCARAREWASNSSEFCQLAGFSVLNSRDFQSSEELTCFKGQPEARETTSEIREIERSARQPYSHRLLDVLKRWIEEMDITEKIMWAIGGLVLTTGAFLLRSVIVPFVENQLPEMTAQVAEGYVVHLTLCKEIFVSHCFLVVNV